MFIGELIEGEMYETHTGELIRITDVKPEYCAGWEMNRDGTGGCMFFVYTIRDARKRIKDII